jgi:hypothetical protein
MRATGADAPHVEQRVDYWPMAISGERGNANDACFAETVWVGKSICSTCKRASGHEEIATCTMCWLAVLFSPLGRVLSTVASELLDAATSVSFAGQRPRGILEAESLSAGFSAARPSECGARGTMSPRARRDCYVRSAANAPCFVCQNARSADGCLCGATWVCDREGPRARPEGNLVLPAS